MKKRIIVRRSVRSMFSKQGFTQLRTWFRHALPVSQSTHTALTLSLPVSQSTDTVLTLSLPVSQPTHTILTLSRPGCHLKMTNKSVKFEILMYFLFSISM